MSPRSARPALVAAAALVLSVLSPGAALGEHPDLCPGYEADPRPQVVGTDADDLLMVPEGAIACGLAGDDKFRAEKHGGTKMIGGAGDDIFCARNNDADDIDGGSGWDLARADEDDELDDIEENDVVVACRNPVAVRY